jgi:hypothetical protein
VERTWGEMMGAELVVGNSCGDSEIAVDSDWQAA